MGTSAHVVVLGGPSGLEHEAAARIADLESRWTRFDPNSELSKLNRAPPESVVHLSPDTYRLVDCAVAAWQRTAGRYDPTVLAAVEANGYDRTFSALPADRDDVEPLPQPAPGCARMTLDEQARTITVPAGVGIDPGGIGKGLAADIVAEELVAAGAEGVLIDLGGDIRVAGTGPEDGNWIIDIEHPLDAGRTLLHLAVRDAGIATSSRLRRQWHRNGVNRHHLIDPATGRPIVTPLVAASVIASEAWWAEALTKVIFVTGNLDTISDASAVAVDELGTRTATRDLIELLS
jgi:thiamine biosynthesis lipoprotein